MHKEKLVLFLLAAVMIMTCGSMTSRTVRETPSLPFGTEAAAGKDKHSEAYTRQRIDTIYKTVGKETFDGEGDIVGYIQSPFNRDSAYCSLRYYALMQEALLICDETGDILYDYDHWICGQDFSDDWSCKVKKVYEITDSTALVDLIIHNFTDYETTIALRFERGDWFIDDFSPSEDGNDDQNYLRETIRQGMEARERSRQDK